MAREVSGKSVILAAAREICRMEGKFGLSKFAAQTTPEFAAAVAVFVVACKTFEALDDHPGEVDRTPGNLPEDDVVIG